MGRPLPECVTAWFAARGWAVRAHQQALWQAAGEGADALLVAPTGAGKTLAGFLPTLAAAALGERGATVYVSPLKALAADIARNLHAPLHGMGLRLSVETRTGDTSSEAKRRQLGQPPDILVTTPESLSLMLSQPGAEGFAARVREVIVDEVHAFAATKRGDLLQLALARLDALAAGIRRTGLSATVADPAAIARWLSPMSRAPARIVLGEAGARAEVGLLVPDNRIPWSGHNGRHAAAEVMRLVERHRLAIVFVNTRAIAELVFRDLWAANEQALPVGIHHGSLAPEARQRVEQAMAEGRLRAVVATSSLDLGVDWGDVDLVVQMGAPKGTARLLQRVGRANHRLDEPSRAVIVPGNRFEYLEGLAALDALAADELEELPLRPGGLDVLAQHIMGTASARPFAADALFAEVRTAWPYAGLARQAFDRALDLVSTGAYALRAYERFRRIRPMADGRWRVSHPQLARQHRANAGVIVEAPTLEVRLGRGRALGKVEEWFASQLRPGDSFMFAGQTLEVTGFDGAAILTRLSRAEPSVPTYVGGRMPLTTNLAARVRAMLADRGAWARMPPDVREWLQLQQERSVIPRPHQLLAETFPRDGRWHVVYYGFEGRHAHQALGMLLSQRMERQRLGPIGFVATDYVVALWSLREVADPGALLAGEVLQHELDRWIASTPFLKRAFREVAVVAGLIERGQPGRPRTGRQLSMSTDLVYDVLAAHEPGHVLLEAAWAQARSQLTDVRRLESLQARARDSLVHVRLGRASPLAVPVLLEAGRERLAGPAEEELLAELAEPDETPDTVTQPS